MKINKIIISFVSAAVILLSTSVVSFAKVVGDKIILGAAISLTGKYSSNGVHTQNGYNMAVDRINSMGGVKVGGKTYKFDIIYYCLLYTSPSPRDGLLSRMPSSA